MTDFIRPRRPKLGDIDLASMIEQIDPPTIPYIKLLRESSAFGHYGKSPEYTCLQWFVNGLNVGLVGIENSVIDKGMRPSALVDVSDRVWLEKVSSYTLFRPDWIANLYPWQNPLMNPNEYTNAATLAASEKYQIKGNSWNNGIIEARLAKDPLNDNGIFFALPVMENEIIPWFSDECIASGMMPYTNAALFMKQIEMYKRCKRYDDAHRWWNHVLSRLLKAMLFENTKSRFVKNLSDQTIKITICIETERVNTEITKIRFADLKSLLDKNIGGLNKNNLVFLNVFIANKCWTASIPVEYLNEKSESLILSFYEMQKVTGQALIKVMPRTRYDSRDPVLSKPIDPALLENVGAMLALRG